VQVQVEGGVADDQVADRHRGICDDAAVIPDDRLAAAVVRLLVQAILPLANERYIKNGLGGRL
jgi:hypothetical protein